MEEVDANYTRISIETAERVGNQLYRALSAQGGSVAFRLQGSVPLNVHIRGVSDVDLLTLDESFCTYATAGLRSQLGLYTSPTSRTSLDVLIELRRSAERALKSAYPAATVDVSGGKAIKISGGSLARPVDVVPSHWFDTIDFQVSASECDRGVTILDKNIPMTVDNFPFLHIKKISQRCETVGGSLRKAIRLCKNVKADAEEDGRTVSLSSFDIAATMFHANQVSLSKGAIYELTILAETQRHLDYLYCHQDDARTLRVPDGSRPIFNDSKKWEGLLALSLEVDELMKQVAREQSHAIASALEPTLQESRNAVASTIIW